MEVEQEEENKEMMNKIKEASSRQTTHGENESGQLAMLEPAARQVAEGNFHTKQDKTQGPEFFAWTQLKSSEGWHWLWTVYCVEAKWDGG